MVPDGHTQTCSICQQVCSLSDCVIDESGHAVHQSCYVVAITKTKRTKYDETEDLLQQARELRELADRLIKQSDALVTAYKNLTGHSTILKIDKTSS